jgi:hypothetical protein
MSLGDFPVGKELDFLFTTYGYDGPATIVGGSVAVFRANDPTPITAGVTLTVDFVTTGLHLVHIDTNNPEYAGGDVHHIVLTAGTVDGAQRAGSLLESFSLEAAAVPTPEEISDSVWTATARTLTDFGSLVDDIWNASARTLTSFGSLVLDVAAQVWNSVASAFDAPGTMGEKQNDVVEIDDPWAALLPGSYPDGSAGNILGTLDAQEITLVSPLLEGGTLQLVAGDAYDLDHGRALDDWALTGQPSLVDAVVTLVIDEGVSVIATSISGAGSGTQVPVFELTSEQTATLTRFGERAYVYQIQATWPADIEPQPAVLAHGNVTMIERAA